MQQELCLDGIFATRARGVFFIASKALVAPILSASGENVEIVQWLRHESCRDQIEPKPTIKLYKHDVHRGYASTMHHESTESCLGPLRQ